MYIRVEDDRYVLIRTTAGTGAAPQETILADLGDDPELNIYFAVENGRRDNPNLWEDVNDGQVLHALENFKRRTSGHRPVLGVVKGGSHQAQAPEEE